MGWFPTQPLDAFPDFVDTITSKFAEVDYHSMVVDADEYRGPRKYHQAIPVTDVRQIAFRGVGVTRCGAGAIGNGSRTDQGTAAT
jgi:hypothetical protein